MLSKPGFNFPLIGEGERVYTPPLPDDEDDDNRDSVNEPPPPEYRRSPMKVST